jgi:hypothetical protein
LATVPLTSYVDPFALAVLVLTMAAPFDPSVLGMA